MMCRQTTGVILLDVWDAYQYSLSWIKVRSIYFGIEYLYEWSF